MLDLAYAFKKLLERNLDGSHNTQGNREETLYLFAKQWHELGFKQFRRPEQISGRHVQALLKRWKSEGLSVGTVKNRMAYLRWIGEKTGRSFIFAKDNSVYGIAERVYAKNDQTATPLDLEKWAQIDNTLVKASLELMQAFGLRREESIKFMPGYADKGDYIELKKSWCKGGRDRTVPVTAPEQRELLDRLHKLAGKGALIPDNKTYIQQRRTFDRWVQKVGLKNPHGIRHHYAQQRYLKMTGWNCPKAGGKTSRKLTQEEKVVDQLARLAISEELGHSREQITVTYLGR
jgi:Phage integrase, N-terminal/Integrase